MLNGTEGIERQLKISWPSLLMWKGRRKKEGSVGMVIYPTGKGKTLYFSCNPRKSCFCLMPFLLTVGWAVFLLGCLGRELLSVMSHIAVHRSSRWAGNWSHGQPVTFPGAGRKRGQADSFSVSSSSLVVSPAPAPFSLIHEQITEGREWGKLFAFQHYI